MIALKIMASGSLYLAVKSMMGQSSMSTERPFHKGARFVRNGSGFHEPGSGEAPGPTAGLANPPLHPVETSRLAPSAVTSTLHPNLESVPVSRESIFEPATRHSPH